MQGLTCSKPQLIWTPALLWSINSKIPFATLTGGKVLEVSFDPGTHPGTPNVVKIRQSNKSRVKVFIQDMRGCPPDLFAISVKHQMRLLKLSEV